MADDAPAPKTFTTLQTVLLVGAGIAFGSALVYVGAKLVQAQRVSDLRRIGVRVPFAIGLSGAAGLYEEDGKVIGLAIRGPHSRAGSPELSA